MSSTEASPPDHGVFPEQDETSEQTAEEEALALRLAGLGFYLKPGHSGKGEALQWATRRGLLEQVHLLLHSGPIDELLRDTDERGFTAAHLAAAYDKPDVLRALIEAGADVSLRTPTGFTPLHFAAKNGHFEVAGLLLANGSDPLWADRSGRTASHLAAHNNHCEMLELLAATGDDLSWLDMHGRSLLHAAARGGARKVFETLVNKRAGTLRWSDGTGRTPVHAAVKSSVGMLKHVLESAAGRQFQDTTFDIDSAESNYGRTALMLAVRDGRQEVVKLLLDYDADIHATDCFDSSAFHRAVKFGHTEIVRDLISKGADVNARHRGVRSYAVLDAVRLGHDETLTALLEGGARFTGVTTDNGWNALHVAASNAHLGILRLLLNKNLSSDINAINLKGSTPLIVATRAGRVDAVRILLEYGANAFTPDYAGRTALHWAVMANCPHIVRMLLKHGADPTVKCENGRTALSIARMSFEGEDLEVMEVLFRDAEDLFTDKHALTELLLAAELGKVDLIASILYHGKVSVNTVDEDGYTSLLFASENGQGDAVGLLVAMGAEVNAINAAGESCIWLASRNGHEDIVRRLLESGADVDSADELEQTSISAAAQGGHLRVVKVLLEKGADVRARTSYGKTAFMFAVDGGHHAVVRAFLVHKAKDLPRVLFYLGRSSLVSTQGNRSERGVDIGDGNCGTTSLNPGPDSESRHLLQASGSDVGNYRENISQRAHDGTDVQGSNGDDAEDTSSEDNLVSLAETGMNAAVERLIRAGHALHRQDRHGCYALQEAAARGHISTVRTLLNHGFDPNLQDGRGMTALCSAAYHGRNEVAQALVDAGAKLNSSDDSFLDFNSPLARAVTRGHVKVLDLLLKAGENKETTNRIGLLMLLYAIRMDHVEVVKHLLKSRIHVGRGLDGRTPLDTAVLLGKTEMVRLLLQPGAVMQTWTRNKSPLCVAAKYGHEDVVKLLLEKCAEVGYMTDGDWKALSHAAWSGHVTVARILVEMGGADVNYRDEKHLTAQSLAKVRGHEGVATLLRHAHRLRNDAMAASTLSRLNYYAYTPLSGRRRIRCLSLHPGLDHDHISFDLDEVEMDLNYSYEALSYEWKDRKGSVPVQCNGRSLLVTPNLKLALQNIRLREKARVLWVDAVCINQEDVEECSSQVRMMTTIYKRASKVLMWLGEDSPDTKKAIESIPVVLSAWTQLSSLGTFDVSTDIKNLFEQSRKLFNTIDGGEPYSREADSGVSELLCRSYFTRAWIYQELVLAEDRGLVLCGRLSVPWRDFLRFIKIWNRWSLQQKHHRQHTIIMGISLASEDVVRNGVTTMDRPMQVVGLLNCGDPRDKVFAVLGIVNPSWSSDLSPDYRLSVQQVYTNVARVIIRETGDLSFWQGMNHPAANRIDDLPSWVPDWTCISTRLLELEDGAILPSLFRHPAGRRVPRLVSSQFRHTHTALYADGYLLDEIAFSVTMRTGEDIYNTIIRPLVVGLAKLGLSIFDPCPRTGTLNYLLVFCRFLNGSFIGEEALLDLVQSHTAFLTWKILVDPNTPEVSRKLPIELEAAVQDFANRSCVAATGFNWEVHGICCKMEHNLHYRLRQFIDTTADAPGATMLRGCDLYCTRSGYLGVAGEGTAESGLQLVLLEGFKSVAMMRKKEDGAGDQWYEFVDGADILEVDWKSYRTLEDVPIDGKFERLKIL